jgi:hypothetical protein
MVCPNMNAHLLAALALLGLLTGCAGDYCARSTDQFNRCNEAINPPLPPDNSLPPSAVITQTNPMAGRAR